MTGQSIRHVTLTRPATGRLGLIFAADTPYVIDSINEEQAAMLQLGNVGVKKGDFIHAVDYQSTENRSPGEILMLIHGRPFSKVVLSITPAPSPAPPASGATTYDRLNEIYSSSAPQETLIFIHNSFVPSVSADIVVADANESKRGVTSSSNKQNIRRSYSQQLHHRSQVSLHAPSWKKKIESDLNLMDAPLWSCEEVTAWIVTVVPDASIAETVCKSMMESEVDGPILMRLEQRHLQPLGFEQVGPRLRFWKQVCMLKRVSLTLVKTRSLTLLPYIGQVKSMLTFGWAYTSEGKEAVEAKEEMLAANSNIAIVSSLVWTLAWAMFFSKAHDCYCGGPDTSHAGECWCRGGYTNGLGTLWNSGRPEALFHFTSLVSVMMYWWSTLIAILQITMFAEMSDAQETAAFITALGSASTIPGRYMVCGSVFLPFSIAIQMAFEPTFGVWYIRSSLSQVMQDQSNAALCAVSALVMACIFLTSFYWTIPSMIRKVYEAKVKSLQMSVKGIYNTQVFVAQSSVPDPTSKPTATTRVDAKLANSTKHRVMQNTRV
mmetsp:Transcript_17335/g.25492  ORF Transcript_17335/g.25492 Transcript_17335/m.25492 type:complete len:548 (-) Transcript_17335:85-1728(-)